MSGRKLWGKLTLGRVSVTLDEEGSVYVEVRRPLAPGDAAHTRVVAEGVNIDYDAGGNLIGVEVLTATVQESYS